MVLRIIFLMWTVLLLGSGLITFLQSVNQMKGFFMDTFNQVITFLEVLSVFGLTVFGIYKFWSFKSNMALKNKEIYLKYPEKFAIHKKQGSDYVDLEMSSSKMDLHQMLSQDNTLNNHLNLGSSPTFNDRLLGHSVDHRNRKVS